MGSLERALSLASGTHNLDYVTCPSHVKLLQ